MAAGWTDALQQLASRLENADLDWMLVGSAATAVRGAPIESGDIDVVVSTVAGVRAAAEVLPCRRTDDPGTTDPGMWFSSAAEPTTTFDTRYARWTFGRWMLAGVKVELAHIQGSNADPAELLIETSGTAVWRERSFLEWNGTPIPIVPLEVQLATMIVREQTDRLNATLSGVGSASLDIDLLRRALDDRAIDRANLRLSDMVERILTEHSRGPDESGEKES